MATVGVDGRGVVGFGDINQAGLLKPTAVFRLMTGALDHWWPAATGLPGPEFLEKTELRSAMVQLEIVRSTVRVPDEQELVLDFACDLGAAHPGSGKPPRYGGRDRLALRPADEPGAPAVATWTAWWLWFRQGDGGRLRLLDEPAPGLLAEQDDRFDDMEPAPAVDAGEDASTFRWTSRETDLNEHVFFMSYVERGENALADAGVDTGTLHRWRTWFLRPAFLGERMTAQVEQRGDAFLVALHNEDRSEVSAVVRAETGS